MSSLNEVPTFMQEKFDPLESAHFIPSLHVFVGETKQQGHSWARWSQSVTG